MAKQSTARIQEEIKEAKRNSHMLTASALIFTVAGVLSYYISDYMLLAISAIIIGISIVGIFYYENKNAQLREKL